MTYQKGEIVLREMSESISLDLVTKGFATDALTLTVSYEKIPEGTTPSNTEELSFDPYGRATPKHAHGTKNLGRYSSSTTEITEAFLSLYQEIVKRDLQIRRFNLTALHLQSEMMRYAKRAEQLDIFSIGEEYEEEYRRGERRYKREKQLQNTLIQIKERYGKNAIVKALDFEEGATAIERNSQIGGHKA